MCLSPASQRAAVQQLSSAILGHGCPCLPGVLRKVRVSQQPLLITLNIPQGKFNESLARMQQMMGNAQLFVVDEDDEEVKKVRLQSVEHYMSWYG